MCSLIMSCSKKAPVAPVVTSTSSSTTTQSILNSKEEALKGEWNLTNKMVYVNGVYKSSLSMSYPFISSHYLRLDSIDVVPQNGTWKKSINSISGIAITTQWKSTIDSLSVGSTLFSISGVTTTSLILHQGNPLIDTSYIYNFGR